MARLKAGTRLKSAVCDTQIMVIAAPDAEVSLTCGGATMLGMDAAPPAGLLLKEGGEGTKMGKRYVTDDGSLELLCTKPGKGSLEVAEKALIVKGAKPLPASD
jgi:hypothetical protein